MSIFCSTEKVIFFAILAVLLRKSNYIPTNEHFYVFFIIFTSLVVSKYLQVFLLIWIKLKNKTVNRSKI